MSISTDDLTPRQLSVAALIAKGQTTKQIAQALTISPRRVLVLQASIAYRIGADATLDERIQIAMWWMEQMAKQSTAA